MPQGVAMDIIEKPWGWEQILAVGDDYKVKLLHINMGERLSLQKHQHRTEFWVVKNGIAIYDDGKGYYRIVKSRDTVRVLPDQVHRVGAWAGPVDIIETQLGGCDDADIVRLADDYDRTLAVDEL